MEQELSHPSLASQPRAPVTEPLEAAPSLPRVTLSKFIPFHESLLPAFSTRPTGLCNLVLLSRDTFRHPRSQNHSSRVRLLCSEPGLPGTKRPLKLRCLLSAAPLTAWHSSTSTHLAGCPHHSGPWC